MDAKKAKLNIFVSVIFKIITMLMVVFVKRTLIRVCGNEVNGLNALYLSIIGVLSVAELGIGTAITFSMYKPIVDGDKGKVSALYHFLKKAYLIVGAFILAAGIALLPFLKYFARDYSEVNANIYMTFLIMLLSVVVTYLFSSKISLINAYKNNYISTAVTQSCAILQYVLQIIVLFLTESFVIYLTCRIVAECAQWAAVEIISRRYYGDILTAKHEKMDGDTLSELKRNIKAMFMHKVGYALVNTVDGVVISAFVGVVALGKYSNYTTILSAMNGIVMLIFTSLTSVIGHMCVQEDRKTASQYCDAFHLMNFFIGVVFFLGYYAVIDNLICILFNSELVISKYVSAVITINGFVQFMRRSTLVFKDATGQFYSDRWKPLIEGICNIVLSILFVNYFGVSGVIIATIITNILICHVVEPYVLYKNAFNKSPKMYYFRNYFMIGFFIAAIFILNSLLVDVDSQLMELFINGTISVVVSLTVCLMMYLMNKKRVKLIFKLFRGDNSCRKLSV